MELEDLCDRLDERLDIETYAAMDASVNGLQVGRSAQPVSSVAVAVDAAIETMHVAATEDADLLLTHHGILWGDVGRVTGRIRRQLAVLFDADMGLYAAHLPLDGHPELGNGTQLATRLGLLEHASFPPDAACPIGVSGTFEEPLDFADCLSTVAQAVERPAEALAGMDHGPAPIERAVVATGNGTDMIEPASAAGADVLITGEVTHRAYHASKEANLSIICGGHYATERFGVLAVAELLNEWGIETTYIEVPTGI